MKGPTGKFYQNFRAEMAVPNKRVLTHVDAFDAIDGACTQLRHDLERQFKVGYLTSLKYRNTIPVGCIAHRVFKITNVEILFVRDTGGPVNMLTGEQLGVHEGSLPCASTPCGI